MGLAVAEDLYRRGHADPFVRQQSLQIVDTTDRLLRELLTQYPTTHVRTVRMAEGSAE